MASVEDVRIYPPPEGVKTSSDFEVSVNGRAVFVHDVGFAAFTAFSLEKSATVSISYQAEGGIDSWKLKPASYRIRAKRENNTITFPILVDQTLDLELNGHDRPLFIFANPMPGRAPLGRRVQVFRGGEVHDAGKIRVRNNETLFLEPGAVVKGYLDIRGKRNVTIAGFGLLDTRGTGKSVHISESSCVRFEGPMVLNDNRWCFAMFESHNIRMSGFRLINPPKIYTDGVDIVGCTDVRLDRFFIVSGDDSIAIKTEKSGFKGPSGNILVQNGVVWNRHAGNGLEIGYETLDDVSDVTFRNIDILRNESRKKSSGARRSLFITPARGLSATSHTRTSVSRLRRKIPSG